MMAKRTTEQDRKAKRPRPTKFPAHLGGTPEEWRALKRQEWREVVQALERFNWGGAYVPAGSALWHLGRMAAQITEAIEADDWVCW